MSKITEIIEFSKFETISTILAQILAVEMANQITLIDDEIDTVPTPERLAVLEFYKESLPSKVWCDRFLAPGIDEMQFLNVVFVEAPFDGVTTHSSYAGIDTYIIEGWSSASTRAGERGDSLSSRKLARMLAVAGSIFRDARYANLGSDLMIGNINKISDIKIAQPDAETSKNPNNIIWGSLTISLKITESAGYGSGTPWLSSFTDLKYNGTDKGNSWEVSIEPQ